MQPNQGHEVKSNWRCKHSQIIWSTCLRPSKTTRVQYYQKLHRIQCDQIQMLEIGSREKKWERVDMKKWKCGGGR